MPQLFRTNLDIERGCTPFCHTLHTVRQPFFNGGRSQIVNMGRENAVAHTREKFDHKIGTKLNSKAQDMDLRRANGVLRGLVGLRL